MHLLSRDYYVRVPCPLRQDISCLLSLAVSMMLPAQSMAVSSAYRYGVQWGTLFSAATSGVAHNKNKLGDSTLPCGSPARNIHSSRQDAIDLHLDSAVSQPLPYPANQPEWEESLFDEADAQQAMVNNVISSREIERHQDVLDPSYLLSSFFFSTDSRCQPS